LLLLGCAASIAGPTRAAAQPSPGGPVSNAAPPAIAAVEVRGNLRVTPERIIGASGLEVGHALDPATVRVGLFRV
jgi:hypothetical protein